MEIYVRGVSNYRSFRFPGTVFAPGSIGVFSKIRADFSTECSPLTQNADRLAREIIRIGGIAEVDFSGGMRDMTVWAYDPDFWRFGQRERQIKELIEKYFGTPEELGTLYLPFGMKLQYPVKK